MKSLKEFNPDQLTFIFTDIDGTLTSSGQLPSESYEALWRLHQSGMVVIPITGRPAGWCEMIARFWPVHGVIGENGGFYFRYHQQSMHRYFMDDELTRKKNQEKLLQIRNDVLHEVPGSAVASDQFCRLMDLAIDFSEDVPALSECEVQTIVHIFKRHGAHAKISNIHVNGWFGDYDKLSMCKIYCEQELKLSFKEIQKQSVFIGDSPNDEPMFKAFTHSIAVANIHEFAHLLQHPPAYVTSLPEALGFVEAADWILAKKVCI